MGTSAGRRAFLLLWKTGRQFNLLKRMARQNGDTQRAARTVRVAAKSGTQQDRSYLIILGMLEGEHGVLWLLLSCLWIKVIHDYTRL